MSQHDRLVSAYLDFSTADPNHRVFFGVDRDLGELPDPSTEHAASRAAEARELLARARALSSEPADFDQGLDRQLMELSFERAAHQATHTWNGRTHLQQHPSASCEQRRRG